MAKERYDRRTLSTPPLPDALDDLRTNGRDPHTARNADDEDSKTPTYPLIHPLERHLDSGGLAVDVGSCGCPSLR